jgi:hypothetical protein
MPYSLLKGKDDSYSVINSATGKVHSKHTTHEKALAQMRLLYGIEGGMEPRGRSMEKKKAKRERTSSGTPLPRVG